MGTTARKLLDSFKAIGLLEHMTQSQFQEIELSVDNLDDASPFLPLNVLNTVPNLVLITRGRTIIDEDQYRENFPQMISITRGKIDLEFDSLIPARWTLADSINFTLATIGKDDRFYRILFPDDGFHGPFSTYALIFLSYHEFKEIHQKRLLRLRTSYSWTNNRVDDILNEFRKLGILSHMSDSDLNQVRQTFLNESLGERSLPSLLDGLKLVYWQDAECIYDVEEDYTKLIEETVQLTKGLFTPQSVRIVADDVNTYEQTYTISITYKDRVFSRKVVNYGDWVDWDYLLLLNDVLAQSSEDGRFCLLESEDQTGQVIFLTNDQFKKVMSLNLLPMEASQGENIS